MSGLPWRKLPADGYCAVFLTSLCFVFFGRYLGSQLPIGVDHTLTQVPWLSQRWDGGLPLWDPFTLGGVPAYDNLQMALLYPLRWPFYFVGDWRSIYGFYVFIHYPIAMLGMFFLSRAWGMTRIASVAAAIVFTAGGHLAGRPINPAILYAEVWVPWLLLGASGDRRWQYWLTTASLALILTVGSPHVMLYGLIAYAIVTLCMARGSLSRSRPLLVRSAHLVAGFALAAPTFIPGLMRVASSVRTSGDVLKNLESSVAFHEIWKIFLGGTGGEVYPEFIDKSVYVGSVALLLIPATLFFKRSHRDRRVIAAFALILTGILISLGKNLGWHHVIGALPGLKWLSAPDRALLLPALGAALGCGLTLDALATLSARRRLWIGATLFAIALIAMLAAFRLSVLWWGRAFVEAPQAMGLNFIVFDGLAGLLLAGAAVLGLHRRENRLKIALVCVIAAQCLHFFPRVLPPMRDKSFYDATPAIHFLQSRARRTTEPFRVAGYDPLRIHNMEVNNAHVVNFLVPQLATLYGLQDVQGFDPLIPREYAALIDTTAGRAPFNDPLRTLDLDWPDPDLLKLLNVRYLLGHPYDRRVTHFPFSIDAGQPEAESVAWKDGQRDQWPREPVTDWLFVSLMDAVEIPNPNVEVARLVVDADEGIFDFPIRNAIETAWVQSPNFPQMLVHPAFNAIANTHWELPFPEHTLGYSIKRSNWRGRVTFPQPLHVRRVTWRLSNPKFILNVAGQACRLARPAENDPWRLAFGSDDHVAPVYEFMDAWPRAWLDAGAANKAGDPGTQPASNVRWLEWNSQSMTLEVTTSDPQTLILLEKPDPGWRAEVNGISTPIQINGPAMMGIAVGTGAGDARVELNYRPRAPLALALLGWGPLAIGVLYHLVRRRRSPKKSVESGA